MNPLQRNVTVCLHANESLCYQVSLLLWGNTNQSSHSAALDRLLPVEHTENSLIYCKAKIGIENFDIILLSGPVPYITKTFLEPHIKLANYIR
jgi:hypothetical protein